VTRTKEVEVSESQTIEQFAGEETKQALVALRQRRAERIANADYQAARTAAATLATIALHSEGDQLIQASIAARGAWRTALRIATERSYCVIVPEAIVELLGERGCWEL